MTEPVDLVDLTPLVDQILFGTTDREAETEELAGMMKALELTEEQVVEEDDPGERPEGLFLTYKILSSGTALYGHPNEDYVAVETDPEEAPDDPEDEDSPEGSCLLRYDNSRVVLMRIAVHAPATGYTDLAVLALARRAQRHLASVTNSELLLLGLDAYVVNLGEVRNAATLLNEQVERVFAFTAELVVQDSYTVQVKTFETMTLSTAEGPDGEEEEREITP